MKNPWMRQLSKRVLISALTAGLLLSSISVSGSYAGIEVVKNNKAISSGAKIEAIEKNATVYVPLKRLFTALGAKISYNAQSKLIEVTMNGKKFSFKEGQKAFTANGKSLVLAAPVILIKGESYLPAHAVEQVAGVKLVRKNNQLSVTAIPQTPLRVGTITGPTGIAMAKLIDDSYLGENVKLSFDMESNATLMPAKLLKKELDIAFVPTNMASIVYNKSQGQVVLLSTNIWGLLSVVSTDPKIKGWDDLKGKQIDIFGQGATPEIAFKALAEANGLDIKKDLSYKMAYDTPATLVAAMASGNTKNGVAVLAEPFTSLLLQKNKNAKILFDVQTEWKKSYGLGFPMSSLVVRKEFLEEHPEVVANFVREFSNNLSYANSNPAAIGKLVEKMPELPFAATVVADSIPRSDYQYQSAASAKAAVAKYLKALYEYDPQTVGGKLPADDFYSVIQLDY